MEHTMDKPATLTLNQERLAERGRQLAMKHAIRDDMVAKEKARRAVAKAELDAFEAEMSQLASTIRAGYETVAQGDLFADQALATEALANVAETACTCNPETPSVHDPGCAVHGVDSEPAQPGKLHKFRVSAKDPEECGVCGFDEGSGIHGRHGFAEVADVSPDDDAYGACAFCPLPEGDEIHQPCNANQDGDEEPEPEEASAGDTSHPSEDYPSQCQHGQVEGCDECAEGRRLNAEERASDDEGGGPTGAEPEGVIDAIKREQDDRPRVLKHRRKAEAGA